MITNHSISRRRWCGFNWHIARISQSILHKRYKNVILLNIQIVHINGPTG